MKEFGDITSFVTHLVTLNAAIESAFPNALDKVGRMIEQDAKRQIGHYQKEAGPFGAWDPLADATEDEKARLGYPVEAPLLRDGKLRDSIQHEVSGLEVVIGSKLDIAEYQEFGTQTIPPRPFIGPAAFKNRDKIERILGAALVQGITGGEHIHESLGYDFDT